MRGGVQFMKFHLKFSHISPAALKRKRQVVGNIRHFDAPVGIFLITRAFQWETHVELGYAHD